MVSFVASPVPAKEDVVKILDNHPEAAQRQRKADKRQQKSFKMDVEKHKS